MLARFHAIGTRKVRRSVPPFDNPPSPVAFFVVWRAAACAPLRMRSARGRGPLDCYGAVRE